jgi:hypothetical protein
MPQFGLHFPEWLESYEVIGFAGVVATEDPRLIFFGKEACAIEYADANVDGVVVGDCMSGEACECDAVEEAQGEYFKSHWVVPISSHCRTIGFVIFSQCAPVVYDKQVKALAENCIRVHHSFLLVKYLECHWNETQVGADKRGVHIDNVVLHFQCNRVRDFGRCMVVVIVAGSKIGYFINVIGKWVLVGGIRFAGQKMGVQGGVRCHI